MSGLAAITPDGLVALTITVYGDPITQGSKTRNRYGGVRDDNADTLHPWREKVCTAAMAALDQPLPPPMAGPVAVVVRFTMRKPLSAPKRRRTWPIGARSGDVDKLQRAIFDALTDVGVWKDDAQVVHVDAGKDYQGADGYLDRPGATITVRVLDEGMA